MKQKRKRKPLINTKAAEFLSGYFGGICGITIGHPVDTLKVRLQVQNSNENFFKMFSKTVKNEGFFSLFKGLTSPVLSEGINDFVLFGAYGAFKQMLFERMGIQRLLNPFVISKEDEQSGYSKYMGFKDNTEKMKFFSAIVSSGIVGSSALSVTATVTDLIKIQMQTDFTPIGQKRKGFFDTASSLAKQRKLFHGFGITMFSSICYGTSYFFAYEVTKRFFLNKFKHHENKTIPLLLSGGLTGMAGWIVCYPSDFFKTRVQQNLNLNTRTLLRNNKFTVKQVFNGLPAVMIRSFPVHAVTFYVYEQIMKFLCGY